MTFFNITTLTYDEAHEAIGTEPSCSRCGEPLESDHVVEVDTRDGDVRFNEFVCRSCLSDTELPVVLGLMEKVYGEPVR